MTRRLTISNQHKRCRGAVLDELPAAHPTNELLDAKRFEMIDAPVLVANQQGAGIATLPSLPATLAPIERSASGLPISVQIIGPLS